MAVGAPASELPASTASAGPGVRFVTTAQGTTWAYAIRDGVVSAVATAAPALARDRDALAAAMGRLASATATQTTAPFEAGATQSAQQAAGKQPTGQPLATRQLTSQPLASATDATVTAALTALCHLQISAPG